MGSDDNDLRIQVILSAGDRPRRILLERRLSGAGRVAVTLQDVDSLSDVLGDRSFDVLVQDLEPGAGEEGGVRLVRGSGQGAELVVLDPEYGEAPATPSFSFLTRPLTPSEIKRLVSGDAGAPPRPRRRTAGGNEILGESPAMQRLLATVERVAVSTASVLIGGETGTGKSLIARALHEASDRSQRPFVVVNCGAFQDQLLESELFGHEKGSFTGAGTTKQGLFEVAHGGTLFLDEVAEMSPAMQAKLLQTLDTGELRRLGGTRLQRVDVRIVAATNKDLEAEVRAGRFREDLLFRLDVIRLEVPSLRQRREDVPALVELFLSRSHPPGQPPKGIAPAALRLLVEHSWPGNVRELANTLEGLSLLAPGPVIRAEDLPPALRPAGELELADAETPLPMSEVERLHILRTLRHTGGTKAAAARLLGIDVKTLNNKLRSYGIGP
jgi:DNA-binding NtrC family response regulator